MTDNVPKLNKPQDEQTPLEPQNPGPVQPTTPEQLPVTRMPVRELLKNPYLPGIGTVIALVGLAVAIVGGIVLPLASKQVKQLECLILSNAKIATIDDNAKGRIELRVDGEPMKDAIRVAVIRIRNCGNVPVERSDYETPLTFIFGREKKAKVIEYAVQTAIPSSMRPQLVQQSNSIKLGPLLLNPEDVVELRFLYAGGDEDIRTDYHIKGVSKLLTARPVPQTNWWDIALYAALGISSLMILFLLRVNRLYKKATCFLVFHKFKVRIDQ